MLRAGARRRLASARGVGWLILVFCGYAGIHKGLCDIDDGGGGNLWRRCQEGVFMALEVRGGHSCCGFGGVMEMR